MPTRTAAYIRQAKEALGNSSMSDRELGELLGGMPSQVISNARYGSMSDPLAIKVARVIGIDAGELITVARMEREKDPEVKLELEAWVAKTLAALPSTTAQVERGGMAAMVDQLAGQRTRRRAAAVVLSLGLVSGLAPAPADAATAGANCSNAVHYVKSRKAKAATELVSAVLGDLVRLKPMHRRSKSRPAKASARVRSTRREAAYARSLTHD